MTGPNLKLARKEGYVKKDISLTRAQVEWLGYQAAKKRIGANASEIVRNLINEAMSRRVTGDVDTAIGEAD